MECEQAVNSSLEVLCVLGTRWRSATHVRQIVVQLAEKSGKSPILSSNVTDSRSHIQRATTRGTSRSSR
jgi:hypothetical protein